MKGLSEKIAAYMIGSHVATPTEQSHLLLLAGLRHSVQESHANTPRSKAATLSLFVELHTQTATQETLLKIIQ
ncbi:hypothetical protein [Bradyrhizobium sp. F1.4.3]|uniref:hypothetical protein n=1 Tax=Bradyrhizobium sp. F1.4.3 TaxID=3156356 RepID=UPI003391707A